MTVQLPICGGGFVEFEREELRAVYNSFDHALMAAKGAKSQLVLRNGERLYLSVNAETAMSMIDPKLKE